MHLQGYEFRFEGLNISVAYFADEPILDFDERVPLWGADDCPFYDSFNDFESFTLREGNGILIVAASNLTRLDMELVNQLIAVSSNDQIKLLVCAENKRYQESQFNSVITSTYNLVSSMFDLAFAIYAINKFDPALENKIADLKSLISLSRSGTLVRYWEDERNKNLINPYDLVEEWSFRAEEGARVIGLWTWLNPANYSWSNKTKENFADFVRRFLSPQCSYLFTSGDFDVDYPRSQAPDVIQLLMLADRGAKKA